MTEPHLPSHQGGSIPPGRAPGLQTRLQALRRRHTKSSPQDVGEALAQEPRAQQEPSIPLLALLDILRKRWWLIAILGIAVGAGVFQWSKTLPKRYRATTTVEVVIRSPRVFSNIRDVISFNYQIRRFYATQKVILESNEIAQKALKAASWVLNSPGFYGLDRLTDKAEQRKRMAKMRPMAYLILKGRTTIVGIRRSSLFRISVTDSDPKRAAALTRAIADSYSEYNRQFRMRATDNAYSKIKAQRERFQNRYKTLDKNLVSFRQKNNLLTTSLTDRRNLAFKNLEEFNNRLNAVILRRVELDSLLRPFMRKKQIDESFPPLLKHKIYWRLKGTESEYALEKEKLLNRYKGKHPKIRRIQRQHRRLLSLLRKQRKIVFDNYSQQLASIRREERSLRRRVYNARQKLQRLERLNLYFARLNEEKKELKKSLSFLNRRFFEVQLLKDSTATNVRVVERARPPKAPFSPRVMRNTALAVFLSSIFFFGLFFLFEMMDNSIRSMEDVELRTGLVPLGEVPLFASKKKEGDLLYNPDRPLTQIEEAIRSVRTNVLFMTSDLPMRKLLFTSPSPREGKTYIAVNMAVGIAHTGKRTLIVDTDMRRPRVHKALSLDFDRSKGASSVMIGQHTVEEAMVETKFPNLWVLPCGPIPPSPTELIQTEGFFAMLERFEELFDVVIFDSPPVNHVADAAVLSNYVDGVLLISSCGSTKWGALQSAARKIESVGGRLLGCVLNKFSHKNRRSYSYSSYGGYYTPYRYQHYGYAEGEDNDE
jgi:capsular exopolysaccharide synthesis family protein